MPRQNAQPELTLFDQIQQLQSSIGNDYNDFTEEDRAALEDRLAKYTGVFGW